MKEYTSDRDTYEDRAKRYFTVRMERECSLDGLLDWVKRRH
jgi:hypothetical protein